MDLAEKILRYRARNSIGRKRLAKQIGITELTLSRIEAGGKYRAVTERKILDVIEEKE